ncbi:regulator of G-protein signaling 7-binding protein-like [Planococcus citri]|uniref:regulator of G-protein signaling 7-binding protein-like n=1 Tax=Planococcus citri TaxID=170843 RepID=UPI0031F9418C
MSNTQATNPIGTQRAAANMEESCNGVWCRNRTGGGKLSLSLSVTPCRCRRASRTSRRSSSIGCRSLLARRSSAGLWWITCQDPAKLISEINSQVALFRDLLIHIGTAKDCPEMREKIRKLRRNCVDACKHTCQLLLPQIRSSLAEGIPMDHPHLVFLFFMCQLFLRELAKCSRLVQLIPMDMSGYFENRAGPSNIGNVISQILLCKQIAPDFNQEEICSIAKDSQELTRIIQEIQEFLPQQDLNAEKGSALVLEEGASKWTRKKRRNSIYNNVGSFCCFCRPNYL